MNIAHLLRRAAAVFPDRPAVLLGDGLWLDYRALAARAASLAACLRDQWGVQPGDRVAIFSANSPEYLEVMHAIYWAGAVSVPVNYKLHAKELDYVLRHAGARVLVVSAELASATQALGDAGLRTLVLASRKCSLEKETRRAHRA